MIHDASIEVSCDGKGCYASVQVRLHYVYDSYSGSSGRYDDDEGTIEKSIRDEEGWCSEDGKQYCDDCGLPS